MNSEIINRSEDVSLHNAALVAGLGLLIMTVFAVGALYFSFPKLVVPGDATATASNIIADEVLFRLGIGSLVIVVVCDVIVAWALYIFFAPVNRALSLLAAWFRLVYAAILGAVLFNYISVLQLLSGADFLKAVEQDQLHAEVMLSLNAVADEWAIGLVLFGIHLVLIGYLAIKSHYVPVVLGALLTIAGFSYLIDNLGMIVMAGYDFATASFAGWGELVFMLWLLIRGVRVQRSQ